jgi:hypothetical protein
MLRAIIVECCLPASTTLFGPALLAVDAAQIEAIRERDGQARQYVRTFHSAMGVLAKAPLDGFKLAGEFTALPLFEAFYVQAGFIQSIGILPDRIDVQALSCSGRAVLSRRSLLDKKSVLRTDGAANAASSAGFCYSNA